MLGDFGEVYVLDWGIARMLTDSVDTLDGARPESPPGETAASAVLGTDGYMPPEQRSGTPVDRLGGDPDPTTNERGSWSCHTRPDRSAE